ncbi:hypothetical protein SmJEL517_g05222 [Synchytrium microbalum]|uniref:Programmed cell death protein 2 C-terminal domain-containing protein n=1 Tax=Synchytrium microbalum TaxID=1806994 RepID=A0A507BX78_9FUNG|nr:uncharacterized protein SmJEL517_g05222 [Synchytrium microbalum]TPX31459.1 hypothetical protein SmJEL517_g05222 [Synchytrium microbalum]
MSLQISVPVAPLPQAEIDAYTDRIGGSPVWLRHHPPPNHIPTCSSCTSPLFLIAQIQAPNPDRKTMGRILYVFGCNSRVCMKRPGSWRVLRGHEYVEPRERVEVKPAVEVDEKPKVVATASTWANTLFPAVDDWADDEPAASSSVNSLTSALEIKDLLKAKEDTVVLEVGTVRSSCSVKQDAESNALPSAGMVAATAEICVEPVINIPSSAWTQLPSFPPHSIEFYTPVPTKPDDFSHEQSLLSEYQKTAKDFEAPSSDNGTSAWAPESYEKNYAKGVDKLLHKFLKTVTAEDASQCIRYQFNGTPLLFCGDDVAAQVYSKSIPPACENCGAARVYECQLMPGILSVLPTEKFAGGSHKGKSPEKVQDFNTWLEANAQGMDFGTVLVYTCGADCVSGDLEADVAYMEEHAVAQVESIG